MSPPCLVSTSPTFQHRGAWTAQVPLSTAQDKFRSSLTFLTSKIRILLRDVRFVSRSEVLADSLVAHPLLFSLHVCSRRVPKAVEWSPPVPDCSQLFDGGMVNSPPPGLLRDRSHGTLPSLSDCRCWLPLLSQSVLQSRPLPLVESERGRRPTPGNFWPATSIDHSAA